MSNIVNANEETVLYEVSRLKIRFSTYASPNEIRVIGDQITVTVTNRRLILKRANNPPPAGNPIICFLPLDSIYRVEDEIPGGLGSRFGSSSNHSTKLILHIIQSSTELRNQRQLSTNLGECDVCQVRLSFASIQNGGEIQKSFSNVLMHALNDSRRSSTQVTETSSSISSSNHVSKCGISGIERKMHSKLDLSSRTIEQAFQDLDQLIEFARPMVKLARDISEKLKERQDQQQQGSTSNDDTVKLKSYLLSMGIADPVTRENCGVGAVSLRNTQDTYFKQLGLEIVQLLSSTLRECGGIMPLTDAFCRLNRARGLELVSPSDVVNACKTLNVVEHGIEIHTFPETGVIVLRIAEDKGDLATARQTSSKFSELCSTLYDGAVEPKSYTITSQLWSRQFGLSVIVAKERLLSCVSHGLLNLDRSMQGDVFYLNLL